MVYMSYRKSLMKQRSGYALVLFVWWGKNLFSGVKIWQARVLSSFSMRKIAGSSIVLFWLLRIPLRSGCVVWLEMSLTSTEVTNCAFLNQENPGEKIRITLLKATTRGDAVSIPLLRAERKGNVCSRAEPSVSGGWTTYGISASSSRSSCSVMCTKSTGRQTRAQSLGCSMRIPWNLKKAQMRWEDFSFTHQL